MVVQFLQAGSYIYQSIHVCIPNKSCFRQSKKAENRALENLGRVYAHMDRKQEAIDVYVIIQIMQNSRGFCVVCIMWKIIVLTKEHYSKKTAIYRLQFTDIILMPIYWRSFIAIRLL